MATLTGFRMGRWLAGRLMKELGLVSSFMSLRTVINEVVVNMSLSRITLGGSSQ